jgi:hypothetical protein
MESSCRLTIATAAAGRSYLHQPVGLPLVTNGPDNANNNANNDFNRECGRCWVRRRI